MLIPIVLGLAVMVAIYFLQQDKLRKATKLYKLYKGAKYDVTQTDGKIVKDLIFVKAIYGRNSEDGNISIIFAKESTFNSKPVVKEVSIKFNLIESVTEID